MQCLHQRRSITLRCNILGHSSKYIIIAVSTQKIAGQYGHMQDSTVICRTGPVCCHDHTWNSAPVQSMEGFLTQCAGPGFTYSPSNNVLFVRPLQGREDKKSLSTSAFVYKIVRGVVNEQPTKTALLGVWYIPSHTQPAPRSPSS